MCVELSVPHILLLTMGYHWSPSAFGIGVGQGRVLHVQSKQTTNLKKHSGVVEVGKVRPLLLCTYPLSFSYFRLCQPLVALSGAEAVQDAYDPPTHLWIWLNNSTRLYVQCIAGILKQDCNYSSSYKHTGCTKFLCNVSKLEFDTTFLVTEIIGWGG